MIIGLRGTGKDLSCTLGSVIIERKRFKVTVQPVSSVLRIKINTAAGGIAPKTTRINSNAGNYKFHVVNY